MKHKPDKWKNCKVSCQKWKLAEDVTARTEMVDVVWVCIHSHTLYNLKLKL